MIQIVDLAAYLVALRKRAKEDHEVLKDTLSIIADACLAEGEEADPVGIAGTMIELAYPGKIGPILWVTCGICKKRLEDVKDKTLGTCIDCRIKEGP